MSCLNDQRKDTKRFHAQYDGQNGGQEHEGTLITAFQCLLLAGVDILGKGIVILTDTIIGVPFPAIRVSPAQGKAASHTVESRCRATMLP